MTLCREAQGRWQRGSWRLSAENVRGVSDDEVRDLKKPLDNDVARRSVPRVHWIQLVESCRYEAVKLFEIENDNAVCRDLDINLQVCCSREIVLPRALGRWQVFFERVPHLFKSSVIGSGVEQRGALELDGCEYLKVDERLRGKAVEGPRAEGFCCAEGLSTKRR